MDLSNKFEIRDYLSSHPDSLLFAKLADLHLRDGESYDAIEICKQGLSYNPTSALGHFLFAKAAIMEGAYNVALNHLQSAIEHDPGFLESYYLILELKSDEMKTEEIIDYYNRILQINPFDVEAQHKLEELRESGALDIEAKPAEEDEGEEAPGGEKEGVDDGEISVPSESAATETTEEEPEPGPSQDKAKADTDELTEEKGTDLEEEFKAIRTKDEPVDDLDKQEEVTEEIAEDREDEPVLDIDLDAGPGEEEPVEPEEPEKPEKDIREDISGDEDEAPVRDSEEKQGGLEGIFERVRSEAAQFEGRRDESEENRAEEQDVLPTDVEEELEEKADVEESPEEIESTEKEKDLVDEPDEDEEETGMKSKDKWKDIFQRVKSGEKVFEDFGVEFEDEISSEDRKSTDGKEAGPDDFDKDEDESDEPIDHEEPDIETKEEKGPGANDKETIPEEKVAADKADKSTDGIKIHPFWSNFKTFEIFKNQKLYDEALAILENIERKNPENRAQVDKEREIISQLMEDDSKEKKATGKAKQKTPGKGKK